MKRARLNVTAKIRESREIQLTTLQSGAGPVHIFRIKIQGEKLKFEKRDQVENNHEMIHHPQLPNFK